jgi:cytochrome c biogenesis protein CcmG, thiol:disulfide interchange protein DsbE
MIKHWNLFSILLLVIGAGWIALSSPPPGSVTSGKIPAPRQGFLAPDFELQDRAGNAVRLSDLRGQPVLVNFWASWCPPCQAEMPAMQRVHETYAEQGYVVLAVNTTYQDNEADARAFLDERGLTFTVLFDRDGGASSLYVVRSMPTSFFIDHEGVIREVVIGGPMSEGLLRSQAEKMLGER